MANANGGGDDGTTAKKKLEYHPTVRDLPKGEQPRQRLRHAGPEALSVAELLAIALRTGTRQDNAIELAGKLLAKYGGLGGLVRADFGELCSEYGMGEAKTAQLKAALEVGRRLGTLHPEDRYRVRSSTDAANLVMVEMAYLDHEELRILLLNSKNQVVGNICRYRGTVNNAVLRVAEIFRPAITSNCPGIIVCHNHPSGDPTPSRDDVEVTGQLIEAGRLLEIELLDHIVIGAGRFVSLKEQLKWT